MLKISSVNPEEWKYPEPKYPLPKGFKYNAVLDMGKPGCKYENYFKNNGYLFPSGKRSNSNSKRSKVCSNKTERKMFYVEISCCG